MLLPIVSVILTDIAVTSSSYWELIRTNGADRFVAVPEVRETCKRVESKSSSFTKKWEDEKIDGYLRLFLDYLIVQFCFLE